MNAFAAPNPRRRLSDYCFIRAPTLPHRASRDRLRQRSHPLIRRAGTCAVIGSAEMEKAFEATVMDAKPEKRGVPTVAIRKGVGGFQRPLLSGIGPSFGGPGIFISAR